MRGALRLSFYRNARLITTQILTYFTHVYNARQINEKRNHSMNSQFNLMRYLWILHFKRNFLTHYLFPEMTISEMKYNLQTT